ncbi:hypothetical protein HDU81_004138 [Chytriomyces hyalinus]|nr:hypothetical protein HDU81_004138 [Chytriomyces hyalinus]
MTLILLLALFSAVLVLAFPAPSALPVATTTADDSEWEWVDVVVTTPCTTTTDSSLTTTLSNSATTISKPPRISRSSSISPLGGNCGGFMANSPKCDDGLVCVYSHTPDLPGTCQRPIYHQLGESCGGTSFNPPICVTGLVCVTDEGEGPHPEGTCQTESASGTLTVPTELSATTSTSTTSTETTSTATTTSATSTTSTTTVSTSTTTTETTATTTTTSLTTSTETTTTTTTVDQPDVNDIGEPCGGFVANPPVCKQGLICVRTSLNPDLPGHCVQAPSEKQTTLQSTSTLNESAPPTSEVATGTKIVPSNPATTETTVVFNTNSPDVPNTPLSSLQPKLSEIIAGTAAHGGSFKDGCVDEFEFVPVASSPGSFEVAFLDVPGRKCGPRDATSRFRRYFSRGKLSVHGVFVGVAFEFRVGYDAVTTTLDRRQTMNGIEKFWSFLYSFNRAGESETEVQTQPSTTPTVPTRPTETFGETETVATSAVVIETTTAYGQVGQACGGGTQFAVECAKGLSCVVAEPQMPGKSGVCQPFSVISSSATSSAVFTSTSTSVDLGTGVGSECGEDAGFGRECDPGLECVVSPPYAPGKLGTCQVIGLIGGSETATVPYESTTTSPPETGTELATEIASTEPVEPTTSFLPAKVNGINGTCGGFIANPPVCADGLICVRNRRIPDMPGRCQLMTSSTEGPTEVVPPAETLTESSQSTVIETASATDLSSSSVSTLLPTEQEPPTAGSVSASTTPTTTEVLATQTSLPLITETSSSANICPVVEPVTVYITKEVHDFVTIHDVVTVTVTVDGKVGATSAVEAAPSAASISTYAEKATDLGTVV